jgi:hypothetical protein
MLKQPSFESSQALPAKICSSAFPRRLPSARPPGHAPPGPNARAGTRERASPEPLPAHAASHQFQSFPETASENARICRESSHSHLSVENKNRLVRS